jgi:DNA polymerase-1
MKHPRPVVIDFETFGIESRPDYPPLPVGVAIKYPGRKPKYFAWAHPTGNNCCWSDAAKELAKAWSHKDGLLFHNGKFDVDVAEVHFGLPVPSWERIHDTLFLLFLDDPRQAELGLKPAAHRLLGWPAEEQDAVGEWLVANQPVPGVRISKSRSSEHYFGRYVAYAPGDLVGAYATGDVERTEAIFNLVWKKIVDRGMGPAYDRERRLMPILLEMERQGLPVDLKRLCRDTAEYDRWRAAIDAWVVKTLRAPADVNLDSAQQLIDALVAAGKVDLASMPRTPTGRVRTAKEALLLGVTDKVLLAVLQYRTQLNTCLNTFMRPWAVTAKQSGGLIYTTWHQTKTPSGDSSVGTRTGRLSSTPNFQNIPKEFQPIFRHEAPSEKLPKCPFKDLPPLPRVRSYVVPFPGHVLIDRDYSQQEPRILAHFEGGALMRKYLEDPWIDFHDYAKAELEKRGKFYERRPVKNTNLGLIYGMGVGKLAERNGMTVEESAELKEAILELYPGLKDMYRDMKLRAKLKQPIRTWGGREYYCEEPRLVDGRIREYDYKLVNVLIQGSAADCTKEAIIRYHAAKHPEAKIILSVHDQITVSVPKKIFRTEMEVLRRCMESVEFDVPILSEGSVSSTNWDELRDYDKKGKLL